MEDADVVALLASVDVVVVARGRKAVSAAPGELSLYDLKGPTGSYRAPMLQVGRRLLVGFHPETLETLLGG